ncbi:MAG: LysE family translocator [Pelagimonas sp.]|jgi:threonine/homoserine/homoserine lactone efflux protein|nr:LysE family translocator [Pelagimonas sp.]
MHLFWTEITAAWPHILLAWSALFLLAIAPGPSVMAIMGISMQHGRRAGMIFTAGCMSGATTWAILAGLGLSIWLTSYANGVTALKLFGGLYLLWMGYKSAKSALTAEGTQAGSDQGYPAKTLYSRGLALHLTNPKAILGWASVITLSQSDSGSTSVLVFTLLGSLLITFLVHFSYAALFASKAAMRSYAKARRPIEATLGLVFGFAGIRLLTS